MAKDHEVNDPRLAEAIDSYNAENWSRALSLLLSMADDGIEAAYARIGFIDEYGYNGRYGRDRGVRQDMDMAMEWHHTFRFIPAILKDGLQISIMRYNSRNGVKVDARRRAMSGSCGKKRGPD